MVQHPSSIVIVQDTVVIHDGEVLGKQSNVPQPNSLLRRVRCSSHVSSPGVAVIGPEQLTTGKNLTGTSFRAFSDSVIAAYWKLIYGWTQWAGIMFRLENYNQ